MLSALLIVSAAIPALSQVVPEAQQVGVPLRIGAGYSNYASDWNEGRGGRLGGPAVWIDVGFPKLPPSLRGFQIEAEGRDLNYNRTGNDPTLREYTFGGGINYAWRYDPAFHPFVKFLAGIGNLDFPDNDAYYGSGKTSGTFKDSRAFYSPGGGVEVRAHERLWVRVDYEYQFWPSFFNNHALTPNGFTVGVFYDFSKIALSQYHP